MWYWYTRTEAGGGLFHSVIIKLELNVVHASSAWQIDAAMVNESRVNTLLCRDVAIEIALPSGGRYAVLEKYVYGVVGRQDAGDLVDFFACFGVGSPRVRFELHGGRKVGLLGRSSCGIKEMKAPFVNDPM